MSQPTHKSYYPEADLQSLYDVYLAGPSRFRQSLRGLSQSEMTAYPIEGKWSIKEIAFHLVDSETVAAVRIRQAITQSDSDLAFYDQDEWARIMIYRQMSEAQLEAQLALFAHLRVSTAFLLKGIPDTAWEQTGTHRRRGEMSVRDLFGLYCGHCEKHIQQILERRRLLGNPLVMEPLLAIY